MIIDQIYGEMQQSQLNDKDVKKSEVSRTSGGDSA